MEQGAQRVGGPLAALAAIRRGVGPVGLAPVVILLCLASVERFDATAFGVLGPEIRAAFHLTNAGYISIATLTGVLPLLATVHIGNLCDRHNRILLGVAGALVWAVTAVLTGLAPVILVLVVARLAGGIGQTVNTPVHTSLLADYYAPDVLPGVLSLYLVASAGIGLLAGPLAGTTSALVGWRETFVILALPTLVFAALMLRMRDPGRGQSLGLSLPTASVPGVLGSFRRLARIRSLRRIWLAAGFFGAGVVIFVSILSLYFEDVYHYDSATRGAITALFSLGGIAGTAVGGQLAAAAVRRQRPDQLQVIIGLMFLAGFVGGMVVMAVAPTGAIAVAGVLLVAIANGAYAPSYFTGLAMISPPDLRGQTFAWSLIWFSFGSVLASPVIGRVGDVAGQRWAVAVLAGLVAISGLLALYVARAVKADVAAAAEAAG
jgi:MFS family permease